MKKSTWKSCCWAVLTILAFAACGESTEVGSEELLNVKEAEQKRRLGEILKSPEPGPQESPQALGAGQPTPKEEKTAAPSNPGIPPLVIGLISDHPYYEPQPNLSIQNGGVMRITNKDDNPRRFRASDGSYDTGDLSPGQTVEVVAKFKGNFSLEDPNLPFATGSLQVF